MNPYYFNEGTSYNSINLSNILRKKILSMANSREINYTNNVWGILFEKIKHLHLCVK